MFYLRNKYCLHFEKNFPEKYVWWFENFFFFIYYLFSQKLYVSASLLVVLHRNLSFKDFFHKKKTRHEF